MKSAPAKSPTARVADVTVPQVMPSLRQVAAKLGGE